MAGRGHHRAAHHLALEMSTGSALVLGAGIGMLAAQVIAVGGVLVADWWLDWVRRG